MAGTGVDAITMRDVSKSAKRRIGRLAYFRSGMGALRRRPVQTKIHVSGRGACDHRLHPGVPDRDAPRSLQAALTADDANQLRQTNEDPGRDPTWSPFGSGLMIGVGGSSARTDDRAGAGSTATVPRHRLSTGTGPHRVTIRERSPSSANSPPTAWHGAAR